MAVAVRAAVTGSAFSNTPPGATDLTQFRRSGAESSRPERRLRSLLFRRGHRFIVRLAVRSGTPPPRPQGRKEDDSRGKGH